LSAAGVVAALDMEARTLGSLRRHDGLLSVGDGTLVAVSGMGCTAAATAAQALVDAGATALVSWGLAGGLDPDLTSGTICLPTLVVSREGATFPTDVHWRAILTAAITDGRAVVGGKLLTSAGAIADLAGKAAAFRDTGAVAVDMESMGVAQVAATMNRARRRAPRIGLGISVPRWRSDRAGAARLPARCGIGRRAARFRPGRGDTTSRSSSTRPRPWKTISAAATSRSTRLHATWPTGPSSIRTTGGRISSDASCGP